MFGKYTHISDYIRNVAMEIAASAARVLRNANTTLAAKKIQLQGAVTTHPTQIGMDNTPIVLHATVDPNKHTHTIRTISGGVDPASDTAIVRDGTGAIRSSGISGIQTGYILANGEDISSLFVRYDDPIIRFKNIDVGSGNVITDLKLTQDGNILILTRTWGTIQQ